MPGHNVNVSPDEVLAALIVLQALGCVPLLGWLGPHNVANTRGHQGYKWDLQTWRLDLSHSKKHCSQIWEEIWCFQAQNYLVKTRVSFLETVLLRCLYKYHPSSNSVWTSHKYPWSWATQREYWAKHATSCTPRIQLGIPHSSAFSFASYLSVSICSPSSAMERETEQGSEYWR